MDTIWANKELKLDGQIKNVNFPIDNSKLDINRTKLNIVI